MKGRASADSLKMYCIGLKILSCHYITSRYSKVIVHFDYVWLEAVTIAGHTAFGLESITCVYTELYPFKDGWVSQS